MSKHESSELEKWMQQNNSTIRQIHQEWMHHLSTEDLIYMQAQQDRIHSQKMAQIARLALQKGVMEFAKRKGMKIPPRYPGQPLSDWEIRVNNAIEDIVIQIDSATGYHGRETYSWLEQQFQNVLQRFGLASK